MTDAGRVEVLRTSRLTVTTWLADDVDDLSRLHADRRVMRYMVDGVQTRERTRARLLAWQSEQDLRGWSKWRVELDGRLVGRAGFGTPHHIGAREVGYLLAPAVWGRGHATELVQALVGWHRAHPAAGLPTQLRAYVDSANTASRRVLAKTGFAVIGSDDCSPAHLVYAIE